MLDWDRLALGLEQKGVQSGEQLDQALMGVGLSLKDVDGEKYRGHTDLPAYLRRGKRFERWPLLMPIAYVVSILVFSESQFEAWGLGWLEFLKPVLLGGLLAPFIAARSYEGLARLIDTFLALDDVRQARLP